MKKIVALLLAALLLTLTACSDSGFDGDENPTLVAPLGEDADVAQTKLVYSKIDSMNPFKAESAVNLRLMSLIYDGLFTLDSTYTPQKALAKGCAAGANMLNVTLDTSRKFSDGTGVTASDVIYSFKLAQTSPAYAERLANFKSVTSSNSATLVFNLEEADVYAQNCLTFPIIKRGSDEDYPVGSGRYVLVQKNGVHQLEANPLKREFKPSITRIELIEIKNSDDIGSSLEIGNTCFSFNDLSGGSYSRVNASTVDVVMNNFVYLGINGGNELLSEPLVRRAINLCLERESIVTTAFQGHAAAAYSPFNPLWGALPVEQTVFQPDFTAALELIAQSGVDLAGKALRLVVNSDNAFKSEAAELIIASLAKAGIIVDAVELPLEGFIEAVENEEFDLYIGEIRLTPDMNITELFSGGACGAGVIEEMQTASYERYLQLLAGDCELMDFINTYNSELPFIPLCYRSAAASYTNSLDYGNSICCDSDVFSNIESWKFTSVS